MISETVMNLWRERCSKRPKTVVFTDALDVRVLEAARYLKDESFTDPILIGSPVQIREFAETYHISTRGIRVRAPRHDKDFDHLVRAFFDKRSQKGLSRFEATERLASPLWYGMMLLKQGAAQACLSGNQQPIGEVLHAALQVLGPPEEGKTVSSFYLMIGPDEKNIYAFADGSVLIRPTAAQLKDVAIDTARNFEKLTGRIPKVALLSFSTKGSAQHERTDKVREAVELIRKEDPALLVDGELQFDAAMVPAVAAQKAPQSPLKGEANVFVFPSLNAANIGYKIARDLVGYKAYGAFVQGLPRPIVALTAHCTTRQIIETTLLTSCLTAKVKLEVGG